MVLTFLVSGGFGGLVKGVRLDTLSLADDERRGLESLVPAAGISGGERSAESARDLRQYALAVEHDGTTTVLHCDERSVPAEAQPLVAALLARSVHQPVSFAEAFPRAARPSSARGFR